MPYKDPEVKRKKHKEYSRKHYEANKAQVIALTTENKKKDRLYWAAFKATLKCTKCGENHPAALDFHHKDPSKKDRAVSWFLKNSQFTKAIEEATKCIVLCANCHRIHHYLEKKKPPEGG
jgi:protein-arginine kinase activator protein McsA